MRAPRSASSSSEATKRGTGLPARMSVAGSLRSCPTVASSAIARSRTLRASGPPTSCVAASGMIPSILDNPLVGLSPTKSFCAAGMRIEPHVSLPHPTAAKLAAIAAPVPPLEPPGLRVRSYGFRVWPPIEEIVVIPEASSCILAFPRITAPASLNLAT